MTRLESARWLPVALVVVVLLAAACVGEEPPPRGAPAGSPTLDEMARDIGADIVRTLARGDYPGRSGEVLLVTKPWTVMGTWGEGIRGPGDPRTSHAVPWSYLERVPITLYGPGHVRPGVLVDRHVDVTDLAPTFAALMGLSFEAPDGEPLREALVPGAAPPKVIVLFVHDGGGWNVLERWPDAWPNGARLAAGGSLFTNATVGSAPPVTVPIHASMGTGAYPRTHGLPEIVGRLPDGSIGELYYDRADPSLLESETVADAWDRANGNRPWVGMVGFEPWHLGMMGQGGLAGDRDVSVLWDRDEGDLGSFFTNEELYVLPGYLPGDANLAAHLDELDASDGARDDRWRDRDLADKFRIPANPAFVAHQGDAIRSVIEHEPLGEDDVTDLLFINLKSIDEGGHVYNMLAPEMEDTLRAQDEVVGEVAALLDEKVGAGKWVLAVTADHGQTPNPAETGGLRVDKARVEEQVEAYFGRDIVETTSPDDLYLRADVLAEAGITAEEIGRFVATLTYEQVAPPNTDLASLPASTRQARVFAAALPGDYFAGLTEPEIDALGDGIYGRFGDLTSPIRVASLVAR